MEQALLVLLGGLLSLAGTWFGSWRTEKHAADTRWLETRRLAYANLMAATRAISQAMSSCVRKELSREEALAQVETGLKDLSEKRSEVWLIGAPATNDASDYLHDWCVDAGITLRNAKYTEEEIRVHSRDFGAPFAIFFDACRTDLGLPLIRTSYHIGLDRHRRGGKPNPYRPKDERGEPLLDS